MSLLIYLEMGPADQFGNIDPAKMIKGTSKDDGHVGWFPVKSITEPDLGRNFSKFTCQRVVDAASSTLFKMAFGSSRPVMMVVDFVNVDE